MDKKETIWDKVARQQAAERELAHRARKLWRQLPSLPPEELTKIFLAFCRAGEEYDPTCRYRQRILRLLPDPYLIEFIGVSMPMAIARSIERRLAPKTDTDSDDDVALPKIGCLDGDE